MMRNIYGLVTRSSCLERTRSPHRRAGLTKLHNRLDPLCMRQPSLSPFTYVGFRVFAVRLVSRPVTQWLESWADFGRYAAELQQNSIGESRVRVPPGLLTSLYTPQSGLANGPEWAALKKHRQRYTPAIAFPDLAEVLDELTAVTVELTQTGSESARYAHLVPFVSKQQ